MQRMWKCSVWQGRDVGASPAAGLALALEHGLHGLGPSSEPGPRLCVLSQVLHSWVPLSLELSLLCIRQLRNPQEERGET
jgi:hypothetical protein